MPATESPTQTTLHEPVYGPVRLGQRAIGEVLSPAHKHSVQRGHHILKGIGVRAAEMLANLAVEAFDPPFRRLRPLGRFPKP